MKFSLSLGVFSDLLSLLRSTRRPVWGGWTPVHSPTQVSNSQRSWSEFRTRTRLIVQSQSSRSYFQRGRGGLSLTTDPESTPDWYFSTQTSNCLLTSGSGRTTVDPRVGIV